MWVEPGQPWSADDPSTVEEVRGALQAVPKGPTSWIVDDAVAPSLLLGDLLDLPTGAETRDGFLRWRYMQHLGLVQPHDVQGERISATSWLLVGMDQALRQTWFELASSLERPIHSLVPRWLWLYNQVAQTVHRPGLLLSLSSVGGGLYIGSLLAWEAHLTLLRQWVEPASPEIWMEDRIHPTAAYLGRESQAPQDLLVWGAPAWPEDLLPVQLLPREIPLGEGH